MTLTSVTFTSTYALDGNGGIFAIENFNGLMTVSSSTFTSFSAIHNEATSQEYEGSLLYSTAKNFGLTMTSNSVQCYSSFANSTIQTHLDAQTSAIAGAFYVANALNGVTSSSNTVKYCYNAWRGAAFSLVSTSMTDTSSELSSNEAVHGGAFYTSFSSLTLTSSLIYDN